jgi:hypothetical protein
MVSKYNNDIFRIECTNCTFSIEEERCAFMGPKAFQLRIRMHHLAIIKGKALPIHAMGSPLKTPPASE